jgi:hypothetical protein
MFPPTASTSIYTDNGGRWFLCNVRKLIHIAQRYIPEESNYHYSQWLADGRKVQNCCRHSVTHMSRSPTSSASTAFFIWVFSLCATYSFVVENIRKFATAEEDPK